MTGEIDGRVKLEIDPVTIAYHEAGHAIAGIAVNRKIDRLSIKRVDGEPRGCKWADSTADEWERVICDLAGPQAQVQFYPTSLSPEQLAVFRNQIVLPNELLHLY